VIGAGLPGGREPGAIGSNCITNAGLDSATAAGLLPSNTTRGAVLDDVESKAGGRRQAGQSQNGSNDNVGQPEHVVHNHERHRADRQRTPRAVGTEHSEQAGLGSVAGTGESCEAIAFALTGTNACRNA
jgi:hypothetical protein